MNRKVSRIVDVEGGEASEVTLAEILPHVLHTQIRSHLSKKILNWHPIYEPKEAWQRVASTQQMTEERSQANTHEL